MCTFVSGHGLLSLTVDYSDAVLAGSQAVDHTAAYSVLTDPGIWDWDPD